MPFAFLNVAAWMHPIAAVDPVAAARAEGARGATPGTTRTSSCCTPCCGRWRSASPCCSCWRRSRRPLTSRTTVRTASATARVGAARWCGTSGSCGRRLRVTVARTAPARRLARHLEAVRQPGPRRSADTIATPLATPSSGTPRRRSAGRSGCTSAPALALIVWAALQPALPPPASSASPHWRASSSLRWQSCSRDWFSMARDFAAPPLRGAARSDAGAGRRATTCCPFPALTLRPPWAAQGGRLGRRRPSPGWSRCSSWCWLSVIWSSTSTTDPARITDARPDLFRVRPAVGVADPGAACCSPGRGLRRGRTVGGGPGQPQPPADARRVGHGADVPGRFPRVRGPQQRRRPGGGKVFDHKPHILTPGFAELADVGSLRRRSPSSSRCLHGRLLAGQPEALPPELVDARVSHSEDHEAYRKACGTAHVVRSGYRAVPVLALGALVWLVTTAVVLTRCDAWIPPSCGPCSRWWSRPCPGWSPCSATSASAARSASSGTSYVLAPGGPPARPALLRRAGHPPAGRPGRRPRGQRPVLVSGHSQGAMISSALFQQLPRLRPRRHS